MGSFVSSHEEDGNELGVGDFYHYLVGYEDKIDWS